MSGPDAAPTTIVGAEVEGALVDVRIDDDRVVAVGRDLPRAGTRVVDAAGGALLPGLHDHHLHLLAMAAARRSLDVADAADADAFDRALRAADADGDPTRWLRVIGYDERHGPLDRWRLDHLAPGRAVRVQHRSGAAWVLSSAGLTRVDAASADGWLHRADADLGRRWSDGDHRWSPGDPGVASRHGSAQVARTRSVCGASDLGPDLGPDLGSDLDASLDHTDLAAVARALSAAGVTGVTDATPFDDGGGFALLAAARADGTLPQRVAVTGAPSLAGDDLPTGLDRGPVKVVVADDDLPTPDALVDAFRAARRAGRAVAVHCVTRVGLVLALTAWEVVGAVPGDRIEHASVVPVELVPTIAELGLVVVTQPAFVWDRGDRYLADVEPDDRPHLYRCASLLAAGIEIGGSTDAPFGPADPWRAIGAAADRRTRTGATVGAAEAVPAHQALGRFLSPLDRPGGPARRVVAGARADLCLLDRPLTEALADPTSRHVVGTWIAGRAHHRSG